MSAILTNPAARCAYSYLISVIVAAIAAALFICMPQIQTAIRTYVALVSMAGFYAFISAWPGFLLTLYVSRNAGWRHPALFAVAGGLNAVLAIAIVALTDPRTGAQILSEFGLASVAGGIAGGLAYVRYGLGSTETGAPDSMVEGSAPQITFSSRKGRPAAIRS